MGRGSSYGNILIILKKIIAVLFLCVGLGVLYESREQSCLALGWTHSGAAAAAICVSIDSV